MCEQVLKLQIKGDHDLSLEISSASSEIQGQAVLQAFALFGVAAPLPRPDVSVEVIKRQEEPTPIHAHNDRDIPEDITFAEAVDAIPVIDPGDYRVTGVKMKHGKPAYKTHYACPNCQNRSNFYVWEGTETIDCYECQHTMTIQQCIKGPTLLPDKMNNYFVAGEMQPVLDLIYSNQKEKVKLLKQHNLIK